MEEKTMGPERRSDSFVKRAKDLPGKIGRSIGKLRINNNPLSSEAELAAEAVGNLGNVAMDPKTANISQATVQETSTQVRRPRTKSASEPSQEPRKKGIGKGGRNALIAVGALATLGGAGYVTYQEVPAVHRSIDRWLNGVPIEEKFPIKLEQSSFTPVTEEEEKKLWENTKMVDLENHTFTIGIPFDQETIDRNPNIRKNQEFDAIPVPGTNIEELREKGVKNVTSYTGLSKGDRFRLIFDEERYKASVITSAIAGETQRGPVDTFTSAYAVAIVILQNRETGKNERFIIEGLYAKLLVENAPFPKGRGPSLEDGTLVGTGTSILELTTDLQDWDGKNEISNNERGQFVVRSYFMQENPQAPIPLTLQYLKASNGDIATHKVLSDGAINYGNGVIGPSAQDVEKANSGK